MNERINVTIPENHYVGINLQRQSKDDVPLAFMTPDGTDAAARKRKESVGKWCGEGGYYHTPEKNAAGDEVFDERGCRRQVRVDNVEGVQYSLKSHMNVLNDGFKIANSIKRDSRWGSGNVVWRIEDPRGFELEISSVNMLAVMKYCKIDEGTIKTKCIWGREGSENVLLPENSNPYQDALRGSELKSKKVKPSDLNIGDIVVMKDNAELIYYGAVFFTVVEHEHQGYLRRGESVAVPHKLTQTTKRHIFCDAEGGIYLQAVASPHVSEVKGNIGISDDMALKTINATYIHLNTKNPVDIVFASRGKPKPEEFKFGFRDINFNDYPNGFIDDRLYNIKMMTVEGQLATGYMAAGIVGQVPKYSSAKSGSSSVDSVQIDLTAGSFSIKVENDRSTNRYHYGSYEQRKMTYEDAKKLKWCQMTVIYMGDEYSMMGTFKPKKES